jgi:predicted kinase
MLIVFAGLPGCGKSTIAAALAKRLEATYLRIDSIEQAIVDAQIKPGAAGYFVAYRVAADNLRLGRMVIADSMNPLQITRNAWDRAHLQIDTAKMSVAESVDLIVAEVDRRVAHP